MNTGSGDWTDFHYSGGFSLEFSREGHSSDPLLPMVVRATIRSDWRVETQEGWDALLRDLPKKPSRGDSRDPARAYMLMIVSGSQVTDLDVSDKGTVKNGKIINAGVNPSGAVR